MHPLCCDTSITPMLHLWQMLLQCHLLRAQHPGSNAAFASQRDCIAAFASLLRLQYTKSHCCICVMGSLCCICSAPNLRTAFAANITLSLGGLGWGSLAATSKYFNNVNELTPILLSLWHHRYGLEGLQTSVHKTFLCYSMYTP